MSLSGAVCSVMLYSNLAYGVTNQVTLEFSTPHNVAPDGILLCATGAVSYTHLTLPTICSV